MSDNQKNASIQCTQPQNVTNYDLIRHLTDADLAWEFLRRNPNFQREMREMQDASLSMTT